MSITFHLLQNNDFGLDQIRKLNELYAEAFEEEEMYRGNKPSDLYLKKLLSKEGIIVCTATSGEQVVGGLTAYTMDKLEEETLEMYVYDLAVDARFRRRKIATRLLELLLEEAKRLDASAVFIQAEQDDAPAVALYESMGERETAYHYDIYLKKKEK
ncbi:GNAT family N-acetyltransferase [Alkalicoccus halolimnae]|uniref:GNAT family N-acetyltransferase n=1 Tax=Alkalicoccus halolimnae TaxID=1667239 RepID=A0A5C7FIW3_9BACI|nr:GNAT family N-acetyltransferase [Alkalicoccus halolimnae]TXF85356.1 GNAT family N-acetyltransferase [Alkalicoccus halolimnae]